jgi:hypothetical protein
MTRPATGIDVALWYCEQCRNSGALLIGQGEDVYGIIDALDATHKAASPGCSAQIGAVRIVRPAGWFKVIDRGKQ